MNIYIKIIMQGIHVQDYKNVKREKKKYNKIIKNFKILN